MLERLSRTILFFIVLCGAMAGRAIDTSRAPGARLQICQTFFCPLPDSRVPRCAR
jgi:hypothetical protein